MEKDQINDLARAALDAACAHIQDALGVKTGDFAALHFAQRQREQTILQILALYAEEQLMDSMPMTYIVHKFHAVELEVQATSAQEARYLADTEDAYQYTLTAAYDHRKGAPDIHSSNYDTEVILK